MYVKSEIHKQKQSVGKILKFFFNQTTSVSKTLLRLPQNLTTSWTILLSLKNFRIESFLLYTPCILYKNVLKCKESIDCITNVKITYIVISDFFLSITTVYMLYIYKLFILFNFFFLILLGNYRAILFRNFLLWNFIKNSSFRFYTS